MRSFRVVAVAAVFAAPVCAQTMRGKVTMEDGSPPPQRALIERLCPGGAPLQEAVAGKNGEFYWKLPNDGLGMRIGMSRGTVLVKCFLRARVNDLESEGIDIQDPKILSNLQLPTMVLRSRSGQEAEGSKLPAAALKNWQAGVKAYRAEQWSEAERLAREVARAAPQFAPAWNLLALACDAQKKGPEARAAMERAIAGDPASLTYRLRLLRLELQMELWADASKHGEELLKLDTGHRYPVAELNVGTARYMLNDTAGARAHWERYLALVPSAHNAEIVRLKLVELSGGAAAAPKVPKALMAEAPEPEFRAGAEASIPGGRKALAAVARISPVPPRETFLAEYCRAIAAQTSRTAESAMPKYGAWLQQYLTSVSELADLGERQVDGRSVLRFSLKDAKAERAIAMLGWRVADGNIEPGARPEDGARQRVPQALGIDELAMKQTLEAGGAFEIAIESETVPVVGGAAWNVELRAFPALPGGIAEAFAREPRLARAYAGLAAMPPDVAAAIVKDLGLRGAVTHHATLWMYGGSFRVVKGAVALPGGSGAEAVWAKLAGASPREPARFFEALLTADRGRLAAFYAAVARADEAHQHFFTANVDRAQRWLAWYRDCEELKDGIGLWRPGWQARVFETLPLDRVKDGIPSDLEAIVALAGLEQRRGRPLDAESAMLLTRNFTLWRPLLPYFEALPALGGGEFRALEEFGAKGVTEARLGQWHATAALIVMGRRSGALNDSAAAAAFGALCRSADAIAVVRQIAGQTPTLDEAVASRLLRLEGARLAGFRHILELQEAPSLDAAAKSGDAATIAAALTGIVYGALLDPAGLLVNEDRGLLRKHVFAPRRGELFAPAALAGARFTGGFMRFDEVSRMLASGGPWRRETAVLAPSAPRDAPELLFRASGRLVEIHATVTDERGRLLDGLSAGAFSVFDGGRAATIAAFENSAAPLSCVLLLDTSQSMDSSIAALKGASMRLIRGLRPDDSVAVYSLSGGITELQAFTTDKVAATRAVLRAELGELTALYDGLVRVNRDLAPRTGKKVIVVLTDGEDTASALSAETAIRRASMAGVPIYTIAQGHAVRSPALLAQLRGMSQSTGGKPFSVATAAEIGPVFENVLQDLLHGYLLAFVPQPSEERAWRTIEVRLRRPGKVRAREGYFPE